MHTGFYTMNLYYTLLLYGSYVLHKLIVGYVYMWPLQNIVNSQLTVCYDICQKVTATWLTRFQILRALPIEFPNMCELGGNKSLSNSHTRQALGLGVVLIPTKILCPDLTHWKIPLNSPPSLVGTKKRRKKVVPGFLFMCVWKNLRLCVGTLAWDNTHNDHKYQTMLHT